MIGLIFLMSSLAQDPEPVGPLPSANQLEWHKRQYYAFVHFGPNTFTGVEWGHGTEDPKVFNPTSLDARQWCRTFKEAGMTGVIITAKHHDGFALWPSKYTTHSVAASPWRGGKGDVLKELSAACKEYDLWMGVYLSPWDRNHPTYGSDLYNDTFDAMLVEVLTQYGDIKEVWFDGANGEGPNGKRQVYDWPRFEATVRQHAPNAVIFHDGGDVRWVGNEQGFVGETNWNFLPSGIWPGDTKVYGMLNTGDPNGDKYSPGECDVSIRPGWFWRESENDKVKTLEQLQEIWYRSIGHGGNLLLNVPPDTRGLIHENDARALMEFRKWREATFRKDVTQFAKSRYDSIATSGQAKMFDRDPLTYWSGDGGSTYTVTVPTLGARVDHLLIQEYVAAGQRVYLFQVMGREQRDGSWKWSELAKGSTVGHQRIVRIPPSSYSGIQIDFTSRSGPPLISNIEAYLSPPEINVAASATEFLDSAEVVLAPTIDNAQVYYTVDGNEPNEKSTLYRGPVRITKSCVLKAKANHEGTWSFKTSETKFTKYEQLDLWPATVFIREPDPGLRFTYYEGGWQTLDQLASATAANKGISEGLEISHRTRDEHFAFVFDGVVSVPQDGIYTFRLTSDDGSRLSIDDKRVVDNDGLHGMETKQGVAPLAAGYHRVRVEYFNATGGMGLRLEWAGPGVRAGQIPSTAYRH